MRPFDLKPKSDGTEAHRESATIISHKLFGERVPISGIKFLSVTLYHAFPVLSSPRYLGSRHNGSGFSRSAYDSGALTFPCLIRCFSS